MKGKRGIMMDKAAFREKQQEHLETLAQYVPVVARVHGTHHPEFHKVRAVYDQMADKLAKAGGETPALDEEFASLRGITNGYTVPDDVCESYEAVYQMLKELDDAYHA